MNKEIETLRQEIDALDDQLIALLEKRFEVTDQVGIIKQHSNNVVYDPKREQKIYDKISDDSIKHVFKTIIEQSKKRQAKE